MASLFNSFSIAHQNPFAKHLIHPDFVSFLVCDLFEISISNKLYSFSHLLLTVALSCDYQLKISGKNHLFFVLIL
ncbi:hypothetical protein HanIR_Chr17g0849971 [Helianthus annuus]|nr:hypothetical protein HanIR_Chr17g0849971 [Helianthus annuus]